jgi:hypothetical protein
MPLPTLLSHALAAMVVGIDNELEARMPHATTMGAKRGVPPAGPWLVSWAVWANLLRFVPPGGIRLGDLGECPGVQLTAVRGTNPGVVRWGYVTVEGDIVRPTPALVAAAETLPALPAIVEQAWADALGAEPVRRLRGALTAILDRADVVLPHYLPGLDDHMWTRGDLRSPRSEATADLDLVALLAQVLLLYTLDHEATATVPLAMSANLLRVVDPDGTPARDLARRAGISTQALAFLTGWRQVPTLTVEAQPKLVTLTSAGEDARAEYERLPGTIEQAWQARFGADTTRALRAALEDVVVAPTLDDTPLAGLIAPPPDGWRSWVRRPLTLPHFPMTLHRGGYPDGA